MVVLCTCVIMQIMDMMVILMSVLSLTKNDSLIYSAIVAE